MRRNAILIGIPTLLLTIALSVWTAQSVAKEPTIAIEAHPAARPRVVAIAPIKAQIAPKPVYHPAVDAAPISVHHKELATEVLNALPAGCRDHLKNFSVLYSGATRRGLGGKTTIILDGSVGDSEFAALLTHECGHVISGNLLGSALSPASTFKDGSDTFYSNSAVVSFWQISWSTTKKLKTSATKEDFVSGYAKSDAFEDFAETFAAYVLQHDMLIERAKTNTTIAAKLAWMETNLPLKEDVLGAGNATWTGTVPWDVTKLAFNLK